VPLSASVSGAVSFVRDGRTFKMSVRAEHQIKDIGIADKVVAPSPEETMELETRHSELAERDQLLEGIAPPARRAPTPTNPEGQTRPDDE